MIEQQKRFKLYKAKKQWLLAAVTVLGLTFGATTTAHAATPAPVQAVTPGQASSSAAVTSAPASSVTSASSQSSQASQAVTSTAAPVSATPVANQTSESAASDQAASPASARPQSAAPTAQPQTKVATATITAPLSQAAGSREVYQNGHWYLKAANGTDLTGWQVLNGNREDYYDPASHQMQYGELHLQNKWYYLDPNTGDVHTGLTRLPDGRLVYYDVQKGHNAVSGRGMVYGVQTLPTGQTYNFDRNNGAATTGFATVNGARYYFEPTRVQGAERYLNGHWYYFASDGKMATSFTSLKDGRVVYYNAAGQMQYGEQYLGGKWYFFDQNNGDVHTGFTKLPDGRLVYYDVQKGHNSVSGKGMLHDLQTLSNGRRYYFDHNTGATYTGFKTINGARYYFEPAQVQNAERYLAGHWYYFGADGKMATGFTQLKDGRTVYYNGAGQMQYGEQYLGGKWYYFDPNTGKMATKWTKLPDGRLVYYDLTATGQGKGMLHGANLLGDQLVIFDQNNGAYLRTVTGTVSYNPTSGTLAYFDATGKLVKNRTVTINGKAFQVDASGKLKLAAGENLINGNWYLAASDGTVKTGFQHLTDGRTVYYEPTTAQMVHGERRLGNYWYYFDRNSGAMHTGLTTLPDGRVVYYDAAGHMQYGWQTVNGKPAYFDKDNGAKVNFSSGQVFANRVNAYIVNNRLGHATIQQHYVIPQVTGAYTGTSDGKPNLVVVHETANPNDSLQGEVNYEAQTYNNAFVHAFIDGNAIVKISPTTREAWGAAYPANGRAVQFEQVEVYGAANFARQLANAAYYTAYNLAKYQMRPVISTGAESSVYTHHMVSTFLGGTDHVDPDGYWHNRATAYFGTNYTMSDFAELVKYALQTWVL